ELGTGLLIAVFEIRSRHHKGVPLAVEEAKAISARADQIMNPCPLSSVQVSALHADNNVVTPIVFAPGGHAAIHTNNLAMHVAGTGDVIDLERGGANDAGCSDASAQAGNRS